MLETFRIPYYNQPCIVLYVRILIVDDPMHEGEGRELTFFLPGVFILEGTVTTHYSHHAHCGSRAYKTICLVGDTWVTLHSEKVTISLQQDMEAFDMNSQRFLFSTTILELGIRVHGHAARPLQASLFY